MTKIICLFIAILYSVNIFGKLTRGHSISGVALIVWAASVTGFITIQFKLFE